MTATTTLPPGDMMHAYGAVVERRVMEAAMPHRRHDGSYGEGVLAVVSQALAECYLDGVLDEVPTRHSGTWTVALAGRCGVMELGLEVRK